MFLTTTLVLHPRHKLEYFKRNKWDKPSIEAARNIVQDKFNRLYSKLDVEGDSDPTRTDINAAVLVSHSFSNTQTLMSHVYRLLCRPN